YDNINVNDDIDLKELFSPATEEELVTVKKEWRDFNPNSESFRVVKDFNYSAGRKCLILAHTAEEQEHYGAIIFPEQHDPTKKHPLLLFAWGLNQRDPTVAFFDNAFMASFFKSLPNHFILIPSFRGQALQFNLERFCSDGFFGDAFDGATDDALRLLHLAKAEYAGIDSKKITAYGISRGGTVALLMGIREPSINAVISVAGPTNFFSKKAYDLFRTQFKYQFLSKRKPIAELRRKMIKSTPLLFIDQYQNHLYIVHGHNDHIVQYDWQVAPLLEQLEERPKLDTLISEGGHNFNDSEALVKWINEKDEQ
ncbi:MAG: prolyl oligopeptidase family serine peptidase, partial [Bacteroidota bacterium]